jgi:hypothetical protein
MAAQTGHFRKDLIDSFETLVYTSVEHEGVEKGASFLADDPIAGGVR